MDELQIGPLMVKAIIGRRFVVERTHACMWNNERNINEVVGETILDGYCLSCHFRWYVES